MEVGDHEHGKNRCREESELLRSVAIYKIYQDFVVKRKTMEIGDRPNKTRPGRNLCQVNYRIFPDLPAGKRFSINSSTFAIYLKLLHAIF